MLEQIDRIVESDIAKGYPGYSVTILKDDEIIKQQSYGYKVRYDSNGTEIANPPTIGDDSVFDLASNTKIYATVLGIMKLVSDGKLDIDLPVINYIPNYKHSNITTRNLLNHSSGYGPEVWFFKDKSKYGKAYYSQDRENTIRLIIEEVGLEYKTGSKSVYSDTGFMMLGIIIEKISGLREDEFLKENIYKPLGLKRTMFNPLDNGISINDIVATSFGNECNGTMDYPNIRKDVIRGEVQDEKAFYSMGGVAGHAGLFSTSEEVATLIKFILNKGVHNGETIIQPEVIEEFLVPAESDQSFACGWRVFSHKNQAHLVGEYINKHSFGHTGFTGTFTLVDFKNNMGIIILSNKIHTKCVHRQQYLGNDYNISKYCPIVEEVYKHIYNR